VLWDVDVLRDEVVRSYSTDRLEAQRLFHRGDVAESRARAAAR
jgi:hypothetical protein